MRQRLLQICMYWYADSSCPAWIQRQIDHHPELRSEFEQLTSLESQLRKSAADWGEGNVVIAPKCRSSISRKEYSPAWNWAVPAVGLVVVVVLCNQLGMFVPKAHLTSKEMVALVPIKAELAALSNVYSDVLPRADKSVTQLAQTITPDIAITSNAKSICRAIRTPMDRFAQGYGSALAYLDRHLRLSGEDSEEIK